MTTTKLARAAMAALIGAALTGAKVTGPHIDQQRRAFRLLQVQAARLNAADRFGAIEQVAGKGAIDRDKDIRDVSPDHAFAQSAQQGLGGADRPDDTKVAVRLDQQIRGRQGKGDIAVALRLEIVGHSRPRKAAYFAAGRGQTTE